ncbi:hypothetical protein FDP41_010049 [Naegleria fowleri]|uniref:Peroxisomal membrane protein MPV17 n=1 Tax=Naegleria fowleri TaxID=5763 RepID=A0A6A5BAS1_NAEFO|nr:uncharacterized protein FDP41_010049 [Naegleria fowleri]KAF0971826.1 hypothetical protein FDP41_010049 [Naegleria fowleri]CAG4714782.1 unnamed protein product [Naegleria fowleri]
MKENKQEEEVSRPSGVEILEEDQSLPVAVDPQTTKSSSWRRKKDTNALLALLDWYKYLLDRYPPVLVKSLTGALISFLATVSSQKAIKRMPKVDWTNVINFTITGGVCAGFSHYWYILLDKIMVQLKSMKSLRPIVYNRTLERFAIIPTLIDQAFYAPFINVVFISVLAFLETRSFSVDKALMNVKRDFWTTLTRGYMLWPIATIVVLSVVPSELRVLFFNIVGFFWSLYLAYAL